MATTPDEPTPTPSSEKDLVAAVYEQLRAIARKRMANERPEHTLQATALVNEALVRLGVGRDTDWSSRSRFLRAAAVSMRRILIDHARDRGRLRRAGSRTRLPLTVVDLASAYDFEETMALEEALRSLEERDPRAAEVVELRFFAGLSFEEVAETLGTSVRTAKRDWTVARAWLHARLGRERDET